MRGTAWIRRRAAAVGFICVVLTLSVRAQDTQPVPPVTFQVEVSYVDVDVLVTDDSGAFVTGLTRDDFELLEDGKPQNIDMFSYLEIPFEEAAGFGGLDRPVAVDTHSNERPFAGRLYVIVLDDVGVSPLRTLHVKRAARQFVQQYVGANDLVAVVHTSGRGNTAQEFTNEKVRLLASIDKFMGTGLKSAVLEKLDAEYQWRAMGLPPQELGDSKANGARPLDNLSDLERGTRAMGVLDTLKNVSEFLASVRGRRKAVLFFSEGIDYPIMDVFGSRNATDVVRAMQDAITMAARSNVNYFPIDPRGLVGMSPDFIQMQGYEQTGPTTAPSALLNEFIVSQGTLLSLADETGGFAAVNSNAIDSAFKRVVDANSRYYLLGYYPPSHPRDGRFHEIDVRVRRPGLKVVARRGYGSPRGLSPDERKREEDAKRARDARRPNADKTSSELRSVLSNAIQESGLTLSAQAALFHNGKDDPSLALAVEVDGGQLPFAGPNEKGLMTNALELSWFIINQNGKAQNGTRSELSLALRPETQERVRSSGIRFNTRVPISPGRQQVRIGVREAGSGRSGTVFFDLDVPDFDKGGLLMSGLLLSARTMERYVHRSARSTCLEASDNVRDKPAQLPAERRHQPVYGGLRQPVARDRSHD